jgi:hypothetical protein
MRSAIRPSHVSCHADCRLSESAESQYQYPCTCSHMRTPAQIRSPRPNSARHQLSCIPVDPHPRASTRPAVPCPRLPVRSSPGKWFLVRVLDVGQLVYRDVLEIVPRPDTDLLDEQRVTSYTCAYDFPHPDDAFDGMPESLDRGLAVDVLELLQVSAGH